MLNDMALFAVLLRRQRHHIACHVPAFKIVEKVHPDNVGVAKAVGDDNIMLFNGKVTNRHRRDLCGAGLDNAIGRIQFNCSIC